MNDKHWTLHFAIWAENDGLLDRNLRFISKDRD